MEYFVLSYYCFIELEDPHAEIANHKKFLARHDARSRIYISEEGINCQMSAQKDDCLAYIEWVKANTPFSKSRFQLDEWHEHAFPRLIVKYRKQLVALDEKVDVKDGGAHLSPEEWKETLDKKEENTIVIDVRNDYEWEVGHFEGSLLPKLEEFRDFPSYARELKKQVNPKETKVLMCCTGGIRCELYSALMKKEGFEEVFQLEGGIINYGKKVGAKHWKGKLFVFDDRVVVPIAKEEAPVIAHCHKCHVPSETYYNCADMDCNKLFISCPSCAEKLKGCCCEKCTESKHLRVFQPSDHPKPFKRKHLL